MDIHLEDYLSAGYVLTQFIDAESLNHWQKETVHITTEDLLPPQILSVGFCGAVYAPIFDWAGTVDEDYARFGIPTTLVPELSAWANER